MRRRSNITKCSHTNIIKMKEEIKGANVNQQQAEEQDSCFLRLAEPQLVQMFIGDGTKLVRDAFALTNKKNSAIIFIKVLAIGTRTYSYEKAGDTEVHRTIQPARWILFKQ